MIDEIETVPPRMARCLHHGQTIAGIICQGEEDSSPDLDGFHACPDEDYDVFYCGCWHR